MKKATDWRAALTQIAEAEGMEIGKQEEEKAAEPAFKKQSFTIKVEKRGAGQKKATIIYGYNGSEEERADFGAQLRKKMSTGGSARGGEILLQGDVAQAAAKLLEEMGHKAKVLK